MKKKYNGKKIIKQKVHKMQMYWEVGEASRIIELHHLTGGSPTTDISHTPLNVWMKAHKGDLALGLKTQTIPAEQSFHIVSRVHAVHPDAGVSVDLEYQLATPNIMHLWEFLGDAESGYEDWHGFNHELEKYLAEVALGFEIITNHCCLTCFTSFKSFAHERQFKAVKLMNSGLGLGINN